MKHEFKSKRVHEETLTPEELIDFMNTYGISDVELSSILGVSLAIIKYWKTGERNMSLTTARLIRMFMKYPHIIREF